MEKLNGWARLWLLLSAIWALPWIYSIGLPPSPADVEIKYYDFEWRSSYINNYKSYFERPSGDVIHQDNLDSYTSNAGSTLRIALWPPLVLLAIGYGIGWVWRGFRKVKSQ